MHGKFKLIKSVFRYYLRSFMILYLKWLIGYLIFLYYLKLTYCMLLYNVFWTRSHYARKKVSFSFFLVLFLIKREKRNKKKEGRKTKEERRRRSTYLREAARRKGGKQQPFSLLATLEWMWWTTKDLLLLLPIGLNKKIEKI